MIRRISLLMTVAALCLSGGPELFCQEYPDHAINLVIPMAPGDGLDISGRLMAEEMSKLLKVPVVPMNKPGGAMTIGTNMVVGAKKDGYTILVTNNGAVVFTKIVQPDAVPYDSFNDLTPLGLATVNPVLLVVRRDSPFKTFKELVEYSKKNPGKIRCGTPGVYSVGDFNVGIIKMVAGAEMTIVPFKGGAPGVTALLGGHIECVAMAIGPLISHMKSGDLKGLLSSNKLPEFQDIPTLKELGFQQDLLGVWFAFFAPAGIQAQVKEVLASAIEKVVKDPTISSKLTPMGLIQQYEPPEKLLKRMQEEYKIVGEIAKQLPK